MSRTTTNYAIPPGWTLNKEMESRGMTKAYYGYRGELKQSLPVISYYFIIPYY